MTARPPILDLVIQDGISSLVEREELEALYGFAECSSSDGTYFFSENPSDIRFALSICKRCPVKSHCLDEAIKQDLDGIWGGTTYAERINPTSQRLNLEMSRDDARIELKKLVNGEVRRLADFYQVNERTIHRWRSRILENAAARELLVAK
jgi:hypothetical protein